jgi:hypothetical protein
MKTIITNLKQLVLVRFNRNIKGVVSSVTFNAIYDGIAEEEEITLYVNRIDGLIEGLKYLAKSLKPISATDKRLKADLRVVYLYTKIGDKAKHLGNKELDAARAAEVQDVNAVANAFKALADETLQNVERRKTIRTIVGNNRGNSGSSFIGNIVDLTKDNLL